MPLGVDVVEVNRARCCKSKQQVDSDDNAIYPDASASPSPRVLCSICRGFRGQRRGGGKDGEEADVAFGVKYFFEAQGTLQYRVATVFGAPVRVTILELKPRKGESKASDPPWIFDRLVELHSDAFDDAFCEASSVVTIEKRGEDLLKDFSAIGLGQLFKKYSMHLDFRLIETASSSRTYTLTCDEWGITCRITERFTSAFLERVEAKRCLCK